MFRPDSLIQQYLQSICQILGTCRRQCPDSSGQTWVPSTWIYNLAGREIISQCVYTSIFAVVAQLLSCVWLFWDSMDCNPPSSSVHGISQARILEWVAISFSSGSSWTRDQTHVSCIGRWILYHWATWEALMSIYNIYKCYKGGKKERTTIVMRENFTKSTTEGLSQLSFPWGLEAKWREGRGNSLGKDPSRGHAWPFWGTARTTGGGNRMCGREGKWWGESHCHTHSCTPVDILHLTGEGWWISQAAEGRTVWTTVRPKSWP